MTVDFYHVGSMFQSRWQNVDLAKEQNGVIELERNTLRRDKRITVIAGRGESGAADKKWFGTLESQTLG